MGKILWGGLAGLFLVLTIVGLTGFSYKGTIEDVTSPPAGGTAAFDPNPLPHSPLPAFMPVEVSMEWSDDDVWLGIVDEAEKERCEGLGVLSTCSASNTQFEAGGDGSHSSPGFTWEMEEGDHYAAIGTRAGVIGPGPSVDIHYTVKVYAGGLVTTILILAEIGMVVLLVKS